MTDRAENKGGVTEITPQSENFSAAYLDVVRRAELADYTPVKGCMVIRPYGYAIWELIQQALDKRFKATGHVNAYFPLFIPESLLMKEKEHVEGFAPQVAWVTRGGDEELEEPLVVRPTSEAIIGTLYAKWIKSWRDLPDPDQPVGERRSLGEGHASVPPHDGVSVAGRTHGARDRGGGAGRDAEDPRAVQGIRRDRAGDARHRRPEEREREFAGASRTYSIEALMGDGRALQAGTSHNLGQNFAKAFEHRVPGPRQGVQHAWTTSWGVSTRLIGGVIMTHGDDSGLVLPPRIAPVSGGDRADCPRQLAGNRAAARRARSRPTEGRGVRVLLDDRDAYTPGWKFAEWELRGVPLRIEIGPKDIEKAPWWSRGATRARRQPMPMDGLADMIVARLDEIQRRLLERARTFREEHTSRVSPTPSSRA